MMHGSIKWQIFVDKTDLFMLDGAPTSYLRVVFSEYCEILGKIEWYTNAERIVDFRLQLYRFWCILK